MAATPTKVFNITEQEKKDYANHMIPMRTATVRFIVKDGIDVAHCQMRVTTWAKAESTFISFKVKIEVSNAYKRPSSICTRPNLVVPKVELLKPTPTPTVRRTTRSAKPVPSPPQTQPTTLAKRVTTKPVTAKPVAAKPPTTKPAPAKPAAAKPAAVKPPSSVARSLPSKPVPAKPAPQKNSKGKSGKAKSSEGNKSKTPAKPLTKYFQHNGKFRFPQGRFYSSSNLRRWHPFGK
nr:hypothetical protein [synthetic construct]AXG22144.1 hypothetical protein [synthetic construct]